MVDLSSINQYMIELDDIALRMVENTIRESGSLEAAFRKQLFYLDCSRVYSNGMRPMQTIGYPYRREMSAAIYIAEQMEETLKEQFLIELIELHQRNIEYEKINPPIWYDGEKSKKKFEEGLKKLPRRRNGDSKPKKETSIERKIKEKKVKLSLLTVNFKPLKPNG